jgi:hypothetical protein
VADGLDRAAARHMLSISISDPEQMLGVEPHTEPGAKRLSR